MRTLSGCVRPVWQMQCTRRFVLICGPVTLQIGIERAMKLASNGLDRRNEGAYCAGRASRVLFFYVRLTSIFLTQPAHANQPPHISK